MFFAGDKGWPTVNKEPMDFIMQFIDPRPPHRFVRLFVSSPLHAEEGKEHVNLKVIDLSLTCQYDGPKRNGKQAQEIVGWLRKWEVFPDDHDGEYELPYDGLKIGGVGNTCQGNLYTHYIQNIHADNWGDGGSLHISSKGELEGDMC